MTSPTYSAIPDSEVDPSKPILSTTGYKFRDNPIAICEGEAAALAAGKGVAIDKDFGAGSQTAIITDELDTTKVLKPDGAGSAVWGTVASIAFQACRSSGNLTAASTSPVVFDIEYNDSTNMYNVATGQCTIAVDGLYQFSTQCIHEWAATCTPGLGDFSVTATLEILYNGAALCYTDNYKTERLTGDGGTPAIGGREHLSLSHIANLVAGDIITVRVTLASTNSGDASVTVNRVIGDNAFKLQFNGHKI